MMRCLILVLCCLQLLLLQGCAGQSPLQQGHGLALRHISQFEVAGACGKDDQFIDRKTLHIAQSVLHHSLQKRLQKKKLLTTLNDEPQLILCLEELHLRPSLVALVLFALAEPDYMTVNAQLMHHGKPIDTWHLKAENSAGGSMATPGEDRRLRMLVNVISRKVIQQLRQPSTPHE